MNAPTYNSASIDSGQAHQVCFSIDLPHRVNMMQQAFFSRTNDYIRLLETNFLAKKVLEAIVPPSLWKILCCVCLWKFEPNFQTDRLRDQKGSDFSKNTTSKNSIV